MLLSVISDDPEWKMFENENKSLKIWKTKKASKFSFLGLTKQIGKFYTEELYSKIWHYSDFMPHFLIYNPFFW